MRLTVSSSRRRALAAAAAALAAAAAAATALPTAALADVSVGDAYARQGANACSWTIGSAAIEKVVTLSGGAFAMTSLKNKLPATTVELVQGRTPSDEFRFGWDGATLRGSSGGWSCSAGSAATVTVGGESAIQLDVTLARSGVAVVQHYVVHPSTSLLREWREYVNTDTSSHRLSRPGILDERMLGDDRADVDLHYMSGADVYDVGTAGDGSWRLRTVPLTAAYQRDFDSYDSWACAIDTARTGACPDIAWAETSRQYAPWLSLRNRVRGDGVAFGFDYHGRWRAAAGAVDGAQVAVSLDVPNYDATLAPRARAVMPKAFTAAYAGDLDDMTNRLLAWQYRYMWDYTRADYFPGIRMLGDWIPGAQPFAGSGSTYDATGTLQKVFGLTPNLRTVGADGWHRDYGWWGTPGDWDGPDWRQTGDYLAKSGMRQTIYYPAFGADGGARVFRDHPSWFAGSPCGYTTYLADLANADARQWVLDLVNGNADAWGDYAWRHDACPVQNTDGATQLGQSAGFQQLQQAFLDAHPGSAIQAVDSGGMEIGWEFMRRASSFSFTDLNGADQQYDASRLFPVDKLSGMPNQWHPEECVAPGWNMLLTHNPDFTGDTTDPTRLECMRRLIEKYRYLGTQGVVGRWVRQYHPQVSGGVAYSWFQRLSRDGERGVLIYKGEPSEHRVWHPVAFDEATEFPGSAATGTVTVTPKGLNPSSTYDVRFELASGTARRTGSDLMANGIALSRPQAGELVYLNLATHPGGGADRTAPSAPASVTAAYATNMGYAGVDVRWSAASDDVFVSRYEVYRDGVRVAVVSKGTYWFDQGPAASTHASYEVRALDGDGNASARTATTPTAADRSAVDDSARALDWSGSWTHASSVGEAHDGTLSSASTAGAKLRYAFSGSGIAWYAKLGPDSGRARVRIDGGAETTVDLFAPDTNNWQIPVFSRVWGTPGPHTIEIELLGRKRPDSSGTKVTVDALQVRTTRPVVTEDDALTYTGRGWERPQRAPLASNQGVALLGTPGPDDSACHFACEGFHDAQGADNWFYEDRRGGTWANIAGFSVADWPTGPSWHDSRPDQGGWVYERAIHPGESADTARTWRAPRPGVIDVRSQPAKIDPLGDGVVVSIVKNGTTVLGPRTIAGDDRTGSPFDVSGITVATGDLIRFVINRNGGYSNDLTAWDPEIRYRAPAACRSACQGFSGLQGANGWRYQDLRGGTWSDIAAYRSHSPYPDGPTWHDDLPSVGGWVYGPYIHPGEAVDTARAWVAPRAGTIDIASVPAKVDPGGDGVVVKVTRNGTTVLGPRTISGSDTTGSAFDATGVTVAAGDTIRFEINRNGGYGWDLTRWDPAISYQTAGVCLLACQQFSDVQGRDNWHYEDRGGTGSWQEIATWDPVGDAVGPNWHDGGLYDGGWMYRSVQHPGASNDTARTWIAPVTGTVDIAGRPAKQDTSASGDGVVVKITRNGRTILGPRTIPATDGTGSAFDVSGVAVEAGDAIRFEINRNGDYFHDKTTWDPQVAYTATGLAPTAPANDPIGGSGAATAAVEATVSGRDVEIVGRTCRGCGRADVWVDGTRVARVDTFAFRGPDAWQAPIWRGSLSAGRHTIRVVPTGTRSVDATGSAVYVDSVQVTG